MTDPKACLLLPFYKFVCWKCISSLNGSTIKIILIHWTIIIKSKIHRIASLIKRQISILYVQSAKILLLPPKYEIIMLPTNHSNFQYCDSNIGLFSISPCKVITLNPLCILFGISLLLFWWLSLSKVIALPTNFLLTLLRV